MYPKCVFGSGCKFCHKNKPSQDLMRKWEESPPLTREQLLAPPKLVAAPARPQRSNDNRSSRNSSRSSNNLNRAVHRVDLLERAAPRTRLDPLRHPGHHVPIADVIEATRARAAQPVAGNMRGIMIVGGLNPRRGGVIRGSDVRWLAPPSSRMRMSLAFNESFQAEQSQKSEATRKTCFLGRKFLLYRIQLQTFAINYY